MSQAVNAQNQYTVTDFGEGSFTTGINNHGEVVGVASNGAFVYKKGRIHTLNLPWPGALPTCINDNGDVAGHYPDQRTAFIYKADGQAIGLNSRMLIIALNNRLEMPTNGATTSHANAFEMLYTGGTLINIGSVPQNQGWSVSAHAINEAGQVVGEVNGPINGPNTNNVYEGFSYTNGHFRYFADFFPEAINNAGQMAGSNDIGAALYTNGHATFLGMLPGTDSGEAQYINDSGEIVGFCYVSYVPVGQQLPPIQPFIYKDGVMRALTVPGWVVTELDGFNDSGQIIATANRGAVSHGILLTPR